MAADDDDDQVEVLSTFDTGERVGPTSVIHERGIPLAQRVRTGAFEDSALNLEGGVVPYSEIEYIALGVIHHNLGNMEPPKGMMRQVVGKIMGKNDRAESKASRVQESTFLDLYSSAHDAPFRLEAANVNYRAFLGKDAQYISRHNFYRLVVWLARRCSQARVNDGLRAFLERRREGVKTYGAVYDFELETQNELARLESMTAVSDLPLSSDSYANEDEGSAGGASSGEESWGHPGE